MHADPRARRSRCTPATSPSTGPACRCAGSRARRSPRTCSTCCTCCCPRASAGSCKVFSEALPLIQDDAAARGRARLHRPGGHARRAPTRACRTTSPSRASTPSEYVAELEHLFRTLLGDRGLTGAQARGVAHRAARAGRGHRARHRLPRQLDPQLPRPRRRRRRPAHARPAALARRRGGRAPRGRLRRLHARRRPLRAPGPHLRRRRRPRCVTSGPAASRYLMAHDPTLPSAAQGRAGATYADAAPQGLDAGLPATSSAARWRYLQPGYHPTQEGSTEPGRRLPRQSPAARRPTRAPTA